MKKAKKFADLDLKQASVKKRELVHEIVKARLSLDATALQSMGGLEGARKELKALSQKIAIGRGSKG
jgi:hypothetical protein